MRRFSITFVACVALTSVMLFGQVPSKDSNQEPEIISKDDLLKNAPRKIQGATAASLPLTMSYQGLLTTTAGTPVADGNYDFQFELSFYFPPAALTLSPSFKATGGFLM